MPAPRIDSQSLLTTIEPVRRILLQHPVYRDMRDVAALRTFMEYHVFAVWDFMSLLKALQQRLCCVSIPWLPKETADCGRLINEIVLGEESDEDGRDGFASHFTLYHRAMTTFGTDTSKIDRFLAELRRGQTVSQSLKNIGAPEAIRYFVEHTFDVINSGDVCRMAAAFTYGREDLLPGVFQKIVDELNGVTDGRLIELKYYLKRHIDLDGGEHGPMAARLVSSLCGDDEDNWRNAIDAAEAALHARIRLWDGIHSAIERATQAA
ncbi:MAG: DUF3050 domain-containing protein [Planctomycetaceae bacterium]